MKNILITVCGRAGSKGFKNKNLKTFLEKPLVYYTLASAFDFKERVENANVDICLNTDSEDLIKLVLAKYPEVFVVERKPELAGDTSSKMAVYQDSLKQMQVLQDKEYDYLIDLDITSPLRKIDDVLGAYEMKLSRPDADIIFSGCESRRNPYFNMFKKTENYMQKVIESTFTARQQAPEMYDVNASIYVFETKYLMEDTTGVWWYTNYLLYIMEDTAILDIDSEKDFDMMQLIGGYLFENRGEFKAVRDKIR